LRCLNTILLLILLQLVNELVQFLGFSLIALNLILKLLKLAIKRLDDICLITLFLLRKNNIFVEEVTLTHLCLNPLVVFIDLSAQIFVFLVDEEKLCLNSAQVSL